MEKTKRLVLVIGIIVLVLICVYVALSLAFNDQWPKGIYLYENDIAMYTDNEAIQFEIGALVVGDDTEALIKSNDFVCGLINDNENIPADCSVLSSYKTDHYYEVDLMISCNLSVGDHTFSGLELKSKSNPQLSSYAPGSIKIIVSNPVPGQGIVTLMIASRTSDTCEFIYGIKNTTTEDIYITGMEGNLDTDNYTINVINNVENGESSLNLLDAEDFDFPLTVPAQKEAYFCYTIPLTDPTRNRYMLLFPRFSYTSSDNGSYKLCVPLLSNPPLIEQTPKDVFKYISGHKELE